MMNQGKKYAAEFIGTFGLDACEKTVVSLPVMAGSINDHETKSSIHLCS